MQFNPQELDERSLYKILIGAVVPRPIAWVSTRSQDGINNLAPFSFFNIVSRKPPMLAISFGPDRPGQQKDTLTNIRITQSFVVNVVTESLLDAMTVTAATWAPEVDEFAQAGLTPAPAHLVKAPLVAESPISFECSLRHLLSLGTDTLVIGEILHIHVADELLHEGRIDPLALKPMGRMAGTGYSYVRELVEKPTPAAKSSRGG